MVCLLGELSILKLGLMHYLGTHEQSPSLDSLMSLSDWRTDLVRHGRVKVDSPETGSQTVEQHHCKAAEAFGSMIFVFSYSDKLY